MKKADLLQITILIVALLCAYSALQNAIYFLGAIAANTNSQQTRDSWSLLVACLVQVLVLLAAMIILVRNSRSLAARLKGQTKTP